MKFKKCAVVSIAAIAMLCSSLSGLCYADSEIPPEATAVVETAAAKNKLSEIAKIKSPFETISDCLITDDGQVYYVGSNSNDGGYIFTLDEKGNVDKKAKLFDYCMELELKQIGDNICVMYIDSYDLGLDNDTDEGWHAVTLPPDRGYKDLYMVMFDKELNQLSKHDITSYAKMKQTQFVGVNSTKVCYVKGHSSQKLYAANYDGSDKKVILDLSETDYKDFVIGSIAVSEKYVALAIQPYFVDSYETEVDCCAVVNLETGELSVLEHDFSYFPEAFGDTMIWRCTLPYDRGGYFETEEAYAKYREEEDALTTARFKQANEAGYMPGVEYVVFKDGKFSTVRTEKPIEATIYAHVDNNGRVMTTSADNYDNHYGYNLVRIYEDSKLVQKIEVDPSDYCPEGAENPGVSLLTANEGILSFRYSYKLNGKYYYDILLVPYDNE